MRKLHIIRQQEITWFLAATMFFIIFMGCSTTTVVHRGQPFSLDENSVLVTNDGQDLDVRQVRLEQDLLSVIDVRSGEEKLIPLSSTRKLVVKKRGKGALQGLGMGALAGIGAGILAASTCEGGMECSMGMNISLGVLVVAPTWAFWGAILGSNRNYVFEGATAISESSDSGAGGVELDTEPPSNPPTAVPAAADDKPAFSMQSNRQRRRWYVGFRFSPPYSPAFFPTELNSSIQTDSEDWKSDGMSSLSVGATLNPQWLAGVRLAVGGKSEYVDSERSWSGPSILLEAHHFPWVKGFFIRGGIGYGYYEYFELSEGERLQLSSDHGYSGLAGLGYAFWIGKTFNLTLNLDAQGARYFDSAHDFALEPSLQFFWY